MRSFLRILSVSALALVAACGPQGSSDDNGGIPSAPPPSGGGSGSGGGGSAQPLTDAEAFRFLQQASFGASADDLDALKASGIDAWISAQMDAPYEPYTDRLVEARDLGWINDNAAQSLFWERAIYGEDQLRERMAYALSQIVVVSLRVPALNGRVEEFGVYLDLLQEQALGNYCQLIRDVSLTPTMGLFLTHLGNRRADPDEGFVPDENYAREVMQLFTIGLEELDAQGRPQGRETYTLDDVQGLAAVFTGLSWADTDFYYPRVTDFNRLLPMESFAAQHESAPKSFLGTTVDVGTDAIISVEVALDHLLAHPNVAPFISKQLIQKLVTSNPSPEYVGRVSAAFEAGQYRLSDGTLIGSGQRCDLAATAAAILTDSEARQAPSSDTYGKIRNPVLRLASFLRAYREPQTITTSGYVPQASVLDSLESSERFGINAYVSPSVFNFYRPGYVGPGTESADAGLLTPEYQLATTPSLVGYINTMEDVIDGVWIRDDRPNLGLIDLSGLDAIADDTALLVNEIDRTLTGGTLSDANKTAIIEALELITFRDSTALTERRRRSELALLMVSTSPEFIVQR